jgi:predicted TPR repeat methyltransferase
MNNLAFLYHTNGDLENAGKMYEKLLRINPEDYQAKHMLAALQGECSLTAPLPYVEQMFDSYSSYYEDSLVQKLGYNVPEIMRKFFSDTVPKSSMQRKVLDLGCGTGLAGVVFKDLSSALTGIDISNKMIDKAAAKGVYDSLINTGIVEYLENHPLPYDLYIAADVFTYIGDLESIFDTIARNSAPEAIFCFSTEKSDSNSFELRNTGRFAHSQKYIETITLLTGWKIIRTIDIDLRKEKELWIDGMLYFLVKSNFNQR